MQWIRREIFFLKNPEVLKQADQCGNSNKVFFGLFCKHMQSFFNSHQTFVWQWLAFIVHLNNLTLMKILTLLLLGSLVTFCWRQLDDSSRTARQKLGHSFYTAWWQFGDKWWLLMKSKLKASSQADSIQNYFLQKHMFRKQNLCKQTIVQKDYS